MRNMHVRFALLLAALLVAMGGVFFWVESTGSELYHQELTQRLNAPVAMYIAGAAPLIVDGVVDQNALSVLAERAMIINPSAEIYLLDNAGKVLGTSLGSEPRLHSQIDLAPIEAVMRGDAHLPVLGQDPRVGASRKVFSVSPVSDAGRNAGFVYVILGGAQYAETVAAVEGGYQQRVITAAIAVTIVTALLIGWGAFVLLTRRLSRLTDSVRQFQIDGDAASVMQLQANGDELETLTQAFDQMSRRIVIQVERIRESDRLRRELITNVSHDLRTPLAAMQGYLDTLLIKQGTLQPEQRQELLETARRHAGRLGDLISDLFELTRLDTGSIRPNFERFSLAELANDVAQELSFKARKKNIELLVEPPQGDAAVIADIGLIQRVLENLIDNAIKYTPSGGKVTMTLQASGDGCAIDVADTGTGIEQSHLPHIFERHYAVARDCSPAAESVGLGLAIVKKILDLHESQIRVHSEPSKGTRFHFELTAFAKAA